MIDFRMVVPARWNAGFTLAEVSVSLFLVVLVFAGVIYGYVQTASRAEWSADSLAAESLAIQGVEQLRAAQWLPDNSPIIDQLGMTNMTSTNYSRTNVLDVPVSGGAPIYATNYISITTPCTNPIIRQFRVDCVWMLNSRPTKIKGPFTNTAITLRAPDQY